MGTDLTPDDDNFSPDEFAELSLFLDCVVNRHPFDLQNTFRASSSRWLTENDPETLQTLQDAVTKGELLGTLSDYFCDHPLVAQTVVAYISKHTLPSLEAQQTPEGELALFDALMPEIMDRLRSIGTSYSDSLLLQYDMGAETDPIERAKFISDVLAKGICTENEAFTALLDPSGFKILVRRIEEGS